MAVNSGQGFEIKSHSFTSRFNFLRPFFREDLKLGATKRTFDQPCGRYSGRLFSDGFLWAFYYIIEVAQILGVLFYY
jgi:hypothetical protein